MIHHSAGIGWCLVLLSLYVDVYYVVIVSYTVFYMFASFAKELPWDSCGNWWNTDGMLVCVCYNEMLSSVCLVIANMFS